MEVVLCDDRLRAILELQEDPDHLVFRDHLGRHLVDNALLHIPELLGLLHHLCSQPVGGVRQELGR